MQTENLSKLLDLQYKLFDLENYDDIADFIVNDSYKIIEYQLAVLLEIKNDNLNKINITNISGTLGINSKNISSEYSLWLKKTISAILKSLKSISNKVIIIHSEDIKLELRNSWQNNLGQELLLANLFRDEKKSYVLILFNREKYVDDKLLFLNLLLKSYQQVLKLIGVNKSKTSNNKILKTKNIVIIMFIGIILAMFVPVTPSVMAPAEIISTNVYLINSPVTGVVDTVYKEPNSYVKKNDDLVLFDQLDLKSELKIKKQELKSLETELGQARSFGFADPAKRGEIFKLQQDIAIKKQEIEKSALELEESLIKSPANGIAIYKSIDDLIGKPVKVGETIMRIADQEKMIIEAWLNINDSIDIVKGSRAYYYSNKHPFTAVEAQLDYYSYEAYVTPQSTVAYRLTASFNDNNNSSVQHDLIIGDNGQVKIFSNKQVFLFTYLFQRPLAKLRQWFYRVT